MRPEEKNSLGEAEAAPAGEVKAFGPLHSTCLTLHSSLKLLTGTRFSWAAAGTSRWAL